MSNLANKGGSRTRHDSKNPQFPIVGTPQTPSFNEGVQVQQQEVKPTGASLEQFYQDEVKIEKKQVSIYLDTDVIVALNKFGKQKGKGAKSDLVNNFLKQIFDIRQGESN